VNHQTGWGLLAASSSLTAGTLHVTSESVHETWR
jgi:hypothetical protein